MEEGELELAYGRVESAYLLPPVGCGTSLQSQQSIVNATTLHRRLILAREDTINQSIALRWSTRSLLLRDL